MSFGFTIAAGAITALLSVGLAYRRFRAERWWERKAEAYSTILQSLFHVQTYVAAIIERVEEGGSLNNEYVKALAERSASGRDEIRKAAAIGSFVVSQESARRLDELETALADPHYNLDIHESATKTLGVVTDAIRDIRPMAKRDLQVG